MAGPWRAWPPGSPRSKAARQNWVFFQSSLLSRETISLMDIYSRSFQSPTNCIAKEKGTELGVFLEITSDLREHITNGHLLLVLWEPDHLGHRGGSLAQVLAGTTMSRAALQRTRIGSFSKDNFYLERTYHWWLSTAGPSKPQPPESLICKASWHRYRTGSFSMFHF